MMRRGDKSDVKAARAEGERDHVAPSSARVSASVASPRRPSRVVYYILSLASRPSPQGYHPRYKALQIMTR